MNAYRGAAARYRFGGPRALRCFVCQAIAAALVVLVPQRFAVAFTQAQAEIGEEIYQHQCARCHGSDLEGKANAFRGLRAPQLSGRGALPCKPRPFEKIRQGDFRTVKDVYEFVSAIMPAERPASLSAEQYWNVLAFLLLRNGQLPDEVPLDGASSGAVVLHADCPSALAQEAHP
jgi:mono/diheme cytochrome c family protein